MPFIIDGYNLLHSIQKTAEEHESITDIGLCKLLDRYLQRMCDSGQVIFDGTGPPDKNIFNTLYNLEITFSGPAIEADEIIENKIRANTAPKKLSVISDDRKLRRAARTRKAVSIRCQKFWGDVQKQLSRKKTAKEPSEKRFGLNESETDKWLDFFDIKQ